MTDDKKTRENKVRQDPLTVLRNTFRILEKIRRYTPEFFLFTILEGVLWGAINSSVSVFTVRLFNSLDKGTDFPNAARIIGMMAIFNLVAYTLDALYWQIIHPILFQKLNVRLHDELFRKARSVDLACYDDPEFYNDFVWSMEDAGARANEVLGDIGKLVNRVVACGTLFTLLFSIDPIVAAVLLASSLLATVFYQIGNRREYEHRKEEQPLWRKNDYFSRVFRLPEFAAELRTSQVTELFADKMEENCNEMIRIEKKYNKQYFLIYALGSSLTTNLVCLFIYLYMFGRLLDGAVLIGSFAATIHAIWQVRWLLSDFVERMTKFPKHSLFLERYYGFLSYQPKITSGTLIPGEIEELTLENVSFSYDFSDKPKYLYHESDYCAPAAEKQTEVLKKINLSIQKGEKIAIVGYNGAGKTTLIKLLMRLYDPTSGRILCNGKDLREYDLEAYREQIGVVFQDYRVFATSIAQNVMNGPYDPEHDRDTVLRALEAAGFSDKLAKLPQGIDTVLTREFDGKGTNLSGGEAQKIAIARVFASPCKLVIMDEPSSALDPVAEYELNQSIMRYANDKTVIFISHRLSTTRMVDRIYMFDSGELIECGSHNELMAQGGKYAEMFNLQAEKYRVR